MQYSRLHSSHRNILRTREFVLCFVLKMCYTLPIMLQRNGDRVAPTLESQRNGTPRRDRDALLEAKDRIIVELREQVALLSNELKRKNIILSRIAKDTGGLPAAWALEAADGLQTVKPGGAQDGRAIGAQKGREKPERMTLPDGYRLVAVASDAWVLVAPRGLRVASYRGQLELWKVALDAREHHQRK